MGYRCPLCDKEMERDLILFLDHTDQHVIDRIKLAHPEWVAEDGACKPCVAYYKSQISGEESNIGPVGRRNRRVMGIIFLGLSTLGAIYLSRSQTPHIWRLGLFVALFLGMVGFIQAHEKTCAVLAATGSQNMDLGAAKIENASLAQELKAKGRRILVKSALAAAVLTALFFLAPV